MKIKSVNFREMFIQKFFAKLHFNIFKQLFRFCFFSKIILCQANCKAALHRKTLQNDLLLLHFPAVVNIDAVLHTRFL